MKTVFLILLVVLVITCSGPPDHELEKDIQVYFEGSALPLKDSLGDVFIDFLPSPLQLSVFAKDGLRPTPKSRLVTKALGQCANWREAIYLGAYGMRNVERLAKSDTVGFWGDYQRWQDLCQRVVKLKLNSNLNIDSISLEEACSELYMISEKGFNQQPVLKVFYELGAYSEYGQMIVQSYQKTGNLDFKDEIGNLKWNALRFHKQIEILRIDTSSNGQSLANIRKLLTELALAFEEIKMPDPYEVKIIEADIDPIPADPYRGKHINDDGLKIIIPLLNQLHDALVNSNC